MGTGIRGVVAGGRPEEATRWLAAMVESANDAIMGMTPEGTVTVWNAAAEKAFGYARDEMLGQPVSVLVPPERAGEAAELRRAMVRGAGIANFETVLLRKDGSRVDVSVTISPVRNAEGRLLGVSSMVRDISERRRAEEQRRRRTLELEALEAALGRLALEQDLDEALNHVLATAQRQASGGRSSLLVWDPQGNVCRWLTRGVPEEQRLHYQAPRKGEGLMGEIARLGRAVRMSGPALHPKFTGYGPGMTPAKSFIGVPVRSKGKVTGVLVVADKEGTPEFTEEDEQVLGLYAALAGVLVENLNLFQDVVRERNVLEAVQCSMTEGLLVVDGNRTIRYANKAVAALGGRRVEELLGRNAADFALGDEEAARMTPEALEAVRSVVRGYKREPVTVEVEVLRPVRRNALLTAFPIAEGEHERLTGMLLRDVTREREVDRRRDTFVSVASHELRTPMTTIVGFAELLLEGGVSEAERREWLTDIYEESRRLTVIVDELLNVSRIQSGRLPVRLEALGVQGPIEIALARTVPGAGRHRFVVKVPPDLPQVAADRDKLVQVLTNLLSNAVKYSPKGGVITVAARHEAAVGRVVMSVTDEGIGIAPEDCDQLFETFHRVRRPETEAIRGSGLGLYIVKRLVELMKGKVWVESELNKGSTFWFTLPAALLTKVGEAGREAA